MLLLSPCDGPPDSASPSQSSQAIDMCQTGAALRGDVKGPGQRRKKVLKSSTRLSPTSAEMPAASLVSIIYASSRALTRPTEKWSCGDASAMRITDACRRIRTERAACTS